MASVTWKGGRSILQLPADLENYRDEIVADAKVALELSVDEGAILTQDYLEAAITPTGQAREEERGGFPGRHDSGNMVGSIGSNGDNPQRTGTIWSAAFGWFAGQFEQYFRDQDLGEGQIPAARALPQAMAQAEESFKRRMRQVVKGRSPK